MRWELYEDKATGLQRVRAVEEYPGESMWRDDRKPFTGYRTINWIRMEDLFVGVTAQTLMAFILPITVLYVLLRGERGRNHLIQAKNAIQEEWSHGCRCAVALPQVRQGGDQLCHRQGMCRVSEERRNEGGQDDGGG